MLVEGHMSLHGMWPQTMGHHDVIDICCLVPLCGRKAS